MKRRALIWLVLNLVVLALLGVKAKDGLHFETDILKLLPKTEQNPLAEKAVRSFSEAMGNRVIFLIGHRDAATARDAATRFCMLLEDSGLFTAVNGRMESDDQEAFYTTYFPHRTAFIPPAQIDALSTAEGTQELLDAAKVLLYSPMASALSPILADDPLLLFPQWVKALPAPPGESEVNEGFLQVQDGDITYVLVDAQLMHSPFDRRHQDPAIAAVDTAIRALAEATPEVHIERTGVLFFAHSGASSAEREVRVIGTGSMLGVMLLMLFAFRSPRRLAISLLPIASGFLFALTASVYCFPDLHLITLGFGASLIGVCVDYSFHYFADALGEQENVDGPDVLRNIMPGITLGMVTSVLAYMGLFIAPFPGLRQMAVFSSVGLVGAFGSVVAWYPALMHGAAVNHKPLALFQCGRLLLSTWKAILHHRALGLSVLALSAVLAAGVLKLRANDDIRQLQTPSSDLVAQEQHIRSLMGDVDMSRFLLVEGADPETVLQNEEALLPQLDAMQHEGGLTYYQSLSQWIPSQQRQRASRNGLRESLTRHRAMYVEHFAELGFADETFDRLLNDVESGEGGMPFDAWYASDASERFRHLWMGGVEGRYASLILLGGLRDDTAIRQLESTTAEATFVNKVDDVSNLFGRYRKLAGWLVMGSYLVIGLCLCVRYGFKKAWLVFMPPCIAAILTLGLLGYMGQPITLFNGLALLLVLGIGIDYTIFFAEARSNATNIMLAIMLSAFTTLLSFGLLSLSQTQALSRFGLTLLIGITLALFFAPMAAGAVAEPRNDHES